MHEVISSRASFTCLRKASFIGQKIAALGGRNLLWIGQSAVPRNTPATSRLSNHRHSFCGPAKTTREKTKAGSLVSEKTRRPQQERVTFLPGLALPAASGSSKNASPKRGSRQITSSGTNGVAQVSCKLRTVKKLSCFGAGLRMNSPAQCRTGSAAAR